jgi:hypothetical protein
MAHPRVLAIASVVVFSTHPVTAQELSRYRGYALESTVAAVVSTSEARDTDVKLLHERPAKIEQLEWRAPYVLSGSAAADPVHDVTFSFYNGALYQLVVTYERQRTEGLTNDDLVDAISATYGIPPLRTAGGRSVVTPVISPDTAVVARWEDPSALLTLVRSSDQRQYQLILSSKTLTSNARTAITEAKRLDASAAPQRELDRRKNLVEATRVASDKARVANKAAFRP